MKRNRENVGLRYLPDMNCAVRVDTETALIPREVIINIFISQKG